MSLQPHNIRKIQANETRNGTYKNSHLSTIQGIHVLTYQAPAIKIQEKSPNRAQDRSKTFSFGIQKKLEQRLIGRLVVFPSRHILVFGLKSFYPITTVKRG